MNLPSKKYNIIYADPPWRFETYSEGGKEKSPDRHYNCMNIEDIYNLPVKDITNEDCMLFIWVTFPLLQEGFETIKRWGFSYKTCAFVWVKTKKTYAINQSSFLPEDSFESFWGLGYWTRSNAELCLLAKKGSISRQSKSVHQLIYDPVREHSRKPDSTRDKIVELVGDLPRIELFARQRHNGWDAWGNEL